MIGVVKENKSKNRKDIKKKNENDETRKHYKVTCRVLNNLVIY